LRAFRTAAPVSRSCAGNTGRGSRRCRLPRAASAIASAHIRYATHCWPRSSPARRPASAGR